MVNLKLRNQVVILGNFLEEPEPGPNSWIGRRGPTRLTTLWQNVTFTQMRNPNWVDGEGRSGRSGFVFAQEYELVHMFAGGFFPATVQVILLDNALIVQQNPNASISEPLHILLVKPGN